MGIPRYVALLLPPTILLAGCATTAHSDRSYTPPDPVTIKNETQLNDSFDAVWDRLVGRLATGFFVINNIDKSSRIINVSYSTDTPVKFVDCGRSVRTFAANGENKRYAYNVAESSVYQWGGNWGPLNNLPRVAVVQRSTSLEGRINIYVAPAAKTTKVSVNTKYILRISTRGVATSYNAFGGVVSQTAIPPDSVDIGFTTAEPGGKTFEDLTNPQTISCEANGTLEQELLAKAAP